MTQISKKILILNFVTWLNGLLFIGSIIFFICMIPLGDFPSFLDGFEFETKEMVRRYWIYSWLTINPLVWAFSFIQRKMTKNKIFIINSISFSIWLLFATLLGIGFVKYGFPEPCNIEPLVRIG